MTTIFVKGFIESDLVYIFTEPMQSQNSNDYSGISCSTLCSIIIAHRVLCIIQVICWKLVRVEVQMCQAKETSRVWTGIMLVSAWSMLHRIHTCRIYMVVEAAGTGSISRNDQRMLCTSAPHLYKIPFFYNQSPTVKKCECWLKR